MYYMLVTIATVGYGDITPESVLGRFAAMFMIILAIIIVPQMTNELMEKLSRQRYVYYIYTKYIHSTYYTWWQSYSKLVC